MNNAEPKITPDAPCPCTSEKDYSSCCGQYIGTKVNAPTAELALQRASLTFKLSNGQGGSVEFGLLS